MSRARDSVVRAAQEQALLDDDRQGVSIKVTAFNLGITPSRVSVLRLQLSKRGLLAMQRRGAANGRHLCRCRCGKGLEG